MAIYDYHCDDCGKVIEVVHGMNDKPNLICPKCQSRNLSKQMPIPTVIFNGTGWTPYYHKTPSEVYFVTVGRFSGLK